jgi:hypothetical protein
VRLVLPTKIGEVVTTKDWDDGELRKILAD